MLYDHEPNLNQFIAEQMLREYDKRIGAFNMNEYSVDPNANRSAKHHKSIIEDCFKPYLIEFNKQLLSRFIDNVYGPITGEEFWKLDEQGEFYFHDRSQLVPYCWAMDTTRLITENNKFGRLESRPMKRMSSYVSAVSDIVDQMSYHVAGAIGLGTLILDMATLCVENERITATDLQNKKELQYRITNLFEQFVYSVNHESRGSESPFTNVSVFGKHILHAYFADKDDSWKYISVATELQKLFCLFMSAGDPNEGGAPYTFPIVTINAGNPSKDEFVLWFVKNCDLTKVTFFFTEEAKIASCCRYINNIELMDKHGKQSNSFAAGFGGLGSHRVITLNLPRYTAHSANPEAYTQLLGTRVRQACQVLKAHKDFVLDMATKDIYHPIKRGWINPNRLFSTLGIIGMPEAQEIATRNGWDVDLTQLTIDEINKVIHNMAELYGLAINVEQVPGETASIKLAEKDGLGFTHYSNQFIPLHQQVSLLEKLGEGRYLKQLTGGGIVFLRVDGKIEDPDTGLAILQMAFDNNCDHLTITTTFSHCENKHTSHGKHETCPVCGGKIIDYTEKPNGYNQRLSFWWQKKVDVDQKHRYYHSV